MFFADISDYRKTQNWLPIIAATVFCDAMFIALFNKSSAFPNINRWYTQFGLSAVIADVTIILIAIGIAQYVYNGMPWNPAKFLAVCIFVQIVHDILYYFALVLPFPDKKNSLIDFMKVYGREGGVVPIIGDSILVGTIVILAMLLASLPQHVSIAVLLCAVYIIPYAL